MTPIVGASPAFAAKSDDPSAGLYPANRNEAYTLDRDITPEKIATTYNNFYEFGSHKNIWRAAQKLNTRPWEVTIDGMVEKEQKVDIDTLLKAMPLEERLYRHRCVEAWAIAVPWTGFPLQRLIDIAKPLQEARYLTMSGFEKYNGGNNEVWVEGLISPIYIINGVIKSIPIIGKVLGGEKGEGVFGMAYKVEGNSKKPRVFVNPLSIITPGAFRNIFKLND